MPGATANTAVGLPGGGPSRIPVHVAIIMDGNGRWAKARGLPRAIGHERGVEALRRTVTAAHEIGIRYLTVYSFSTENWSRPLEEVNALFNLLRAFVKRDLARLNREGVRIRMAGRRADVPQDILALMDEAEACTQANDKLVLTVAFNYGSRAEIVDAARKLAGDVQAGSLSPGDITEEMFAAAMQSSGVPDPDLLVRTSGECRISNFLLWQLAYAEMVFQDVLWPDFDKQHLLAAVEAFGCRERRFGAVSPPGAV